MKSVMHPALIFALGVVVTLGLVWRRGAAEADKANPVNGPRYTVVATDGAHLIVTDNGTNKVYFYAIDKDGKIGDELKLRGSPRQLEHSTIPRRERARPHERTPYEEAPVDR
jgi:hypothetical protein